MAITDIFSGALSLVGYELDDNLDDIEGFLQSNLGIGTYIDLTSVSWSGYFAAAALSSAGYDIPNGYSSVSNWSSYGQPATAPAPGSVAILPVDSSGYAHVGIVIGFSATNQPIILSGDVGSAVVLTPMDVTGATYRTPTSPSSTSAATASLAGVTTASLVSPIGSSSASTGTAFANAATAALVSAVATGQTAGLSAGLTSGINTALAGAGVPAPLASALSSAISSLLGGSAAPARQGAQIGNKDTPEKNSARAKSGPMPCGMQHADVTGKPGAFKASSTYSPVSRLPTHEPFTGHPIAASKTTNSQDGSTASGSSGTGGGATNPTTGGTPGGGGGGGGGGNGSPGSPGNVDLSGTAIQRATSLIASKEGLILTAKYDVNHYRVGYGSDTWTDANGGIHNVTAGTTITKADADRDLARRTQIFMNAAANTIGVAAWNNLSPDAQAALTSIAYNYGSLNKLKSVVSAARTGDPNALANAITNLQGANNGVNAKRRLQEANIVRNGGTAANPTNGPVGATSQGANTTAAKTAAAAAAAQAQQVGQQTAQKIANTSAAALGQGSSPAQSPQIVGGGSLNKNKYNPNAPTGNSTDPDAGTDQTNAVGGTPADGGGTGSGGSGGGSPAPSGQDGTQGLTPAAKAAGYVPTDSPGVSAVPAPAPAETPGVQFTTKTYTKQ